MDSNNGRLYLNFDNQRPAANDRAYPTTPSTFPQPVFPAGAQSSMQSSQQQYGAGYPPQGQGYFAQNQQYPGQAVTSDYPNAAYPPQSGAPGTNDPNTGLAHQFSHQNLGGSAARGGQYAGRGPSSGRPRTAGGSGQQGSYGNYAPPLPTQGAVSSPEFQPIPERNPDKYGTNANSNQKKCSQLAADFFKDSVKRARERNQRYSLFHLYTHTHTHTLYPYIHLSRLAPLPSARPSRKPHQCPVG